ncbi:MAG: hypothetical protein AAGJ52_13230 [Pseudomonadota bacterium]
MKRRASYQTRTVKFQRLVEFTGWRIKVYRITRNDDAPPFETFFNQSVRPLLDLLPDIDSVNHGVAILILHHGEHRNWLLLDWWFDQEILKQRLFSSPVDVPGDITEAEADLMACTWEMAIHCFERQAWIDDVLANPAGPDLDAYLAKQLNAEV